MKVLAIIQARMGSTRLPGKVLKPILGKPMLVHIVERLRRVGKINEVVVATSEERINDSIRKICEENKISCFSGSENDVLDRFYKTARMHKADVVIRITADCPLVDPTLIDKVLTLFLKSKRYDHIFVATGAGAADKKFDGYRYPDGLDTEIFSFSVLEIAWKEAKEQLEREHVTSFVWKRPDRFKIGSYKSDVDYSKMRWTVDNQEDLEVVSAIYAELYPKKPDFNMEDVLNFFKKNPKLVQKNVHFIGEEGYERFWK